ncbi:MAG: glycoside hydrolase family 3 C-terminal domain-containing protein [Cyclobacteriaceae bacterium]|nr:glycoside hydrolase family 3 C-terminal domain-containing protein [Cyclobacteriaceae bacterium]
MCITRFVSIAWILAWAIAGQAQPKLPYKNPSLPINARVNDLLTRMTPEEKFWQLFMIPGDLSDGKEKYKNGIFGLQVRASLSQDAAGQLITSSQALNARESVQKINAIQKYFVEQTRLGIPILPFEEALHGLVSPGSTSYPVPIALAATWDTSLIHRVASMIAGETRSRGFRYVLSPVVNVAPDPRWGRTEETYGEDPFLSAEMGVAFVSAFEKTGIVTSPKHFLANSGDGGRDSYPINADERFLEEYYLPPFRAVIERGGARSIMTSYNSIGGKPGSANGWLLNTKLKGDLKFRGFIISDAGAIGGANVLHFTAADYEDATVKAMQNGAHVIFQTSYDHHKLFMSPFLDGRIDRSLIDSAVARVLRVKFELGLFEKPYADENGVAKWTANSSQKATAKEAALKSIVLLKNENHVLPLGKELSSLAVIGIDAVEARLGGYSRPGKAEISILDGIKGKVGTKTKVTYSPGCGRTITEWVPVPSSSLYSMENGKRVNGLKSEYFSNIDLGGEPTLKRTDREINFRWTLYSPYPSIPFDFFSVRWTGKLKPPISGTFKIGFAGNDGYRLYIDGDLIIDHWKSQGVKTTLANFTFEKDREYDLRAEFFEASGVSSIKLVWNLGVEDMGKARINEAVEVASKADAVVVVAGIDEGEGLDRAYLNLPGYQEELIRRVAATGKPVVVVLVGGSAITLKGWLDQVPSVLDVWYPGDQGGEAVADILFGVHNPAGRLPISFPVFEGQLPYSYSHKPTGRNDDYADLTGLPLFPFGFGLSYSSFEYSGLRFDKSTIGAGENTMVRFSIRNTSKLDGEEVVQLYIRDELSSVAQPIKLLKGFQRVALKAGEARELSFVVTPELLKILDEQMKWVVEPGEFRIMIGASSRDIRLRAILTVAR